MPSELTKKACTEIAHRLNILLCSEFMLYVKTLNYHWNIHSKHFGPLHKLFEKQYEQLFEHIDRIAERVRALDVPALATLKEFYQYSILHEQQDTALSEQQMLQDLVDSYKTIINQMRQDIDLTTKYHDDGTNNMLADLIEQHEKTRWMLQSHIE